MQKLKLIIIMFSILLTDFTWADNKAILITVNQFAHHPALDAVVLGFTESLNKDEWLKSQKIEVITENAQGNVASAVQIAQHLASLKPEVMVSVATPSSQATLKARKSSNTVMAFAAVSDPEGAGLTGQQNVIGVADRPPVTELLDLAFSMLTNVTTMGIITNQSEINSAKTSKIASDYVAAKGIKLVSASIRSTNDILSAIESLVGKVDFIYLPQDNTVISGINVIAKIAAKNKIPLISNDPALIDKGVVLAFGCDYKESGRQLGAMVVAKMRRSLPGNLLIQDARVKKIKINHELAGRLNIKVPAAIKAKLGGQDE